MAALPDASQRLESSASSLLYHMASPTDLAAGLEGGGGLCTAGSGLYGVKEKKKKKLHARGIYQKHNSVTRGPSTL